MWSIASLPLRGGNRARARQMCTGGFCRRSLSRPTDLVMLSRTIVRAADLEFGSDFCSRDVKSQPLTPDHTRKQLPQKHGPSTLGIGSA